jgi:hypothetical protein
MPSGPQRTNFKQMWHVGDAADINNSAKFHVKNFAGLKSACSHRKNRSSSLLCEHAIGSKLGTSISEVH